jgi:hypothetical protein
MGIPSPVGHATKVVSVAGGLGVAPIFPRARAFKESGACVDGPDFDVHTVGLDDLVHRPSRARARRTLR